MTEAEIDKLLDVSYYGSITPIVCVEHLAYESQDDALRALQEKTEGIPFNLKRLSYYDGYPGLHAFGVKNMATNECIYGKVNLANGYIELLPTVCFISEE